MATDLEREMKELLSERAGDVRPHDEAPPRMLRRARVRRLGTAIGSSVVVAALVAGAVVGARTLLAPSAAPPETRLGGPADEPFAVWPQSTREEAQDAQTCVDAGREECMWQLNALEVVRRYGEQELGWQDIFVFVEGFIEDYRKLPLGEDVGSALTDVVDPLSVVISECLPPHRGMCGMAELRLEKPLRPDVTGIWLIMDSRHIPAETTQEEPGGTAVAQEASPAQELPSSVDLRIQRFMQARFSGVGAEAFLSEDASRKYEQGVGGLSLYEYTTDEGTSYEVQGWEDQGTPDLEVYSVIVTIENGNSTVATEILELRPPPCPPDMVCDFDYTITDAERIE